jgi:hypothetical protein
MKSMAFSVRNSAVRRAFLSPVTGGESVLPLASRHGLPTLLSRAEAVSAEVPLAEVAGGVPGGLQTFRKRLHFQRQMRGHGRIDQFGEGPAMSGNMLGDAETGLILPRLKIRAGRRADRPGVELRKPHSLSREAVDARRLVERVAVTPQVGPAQIIGQNDDDVRRRSGLCLFRRLARCRRDGNMSTRQNRQKSKLFDHGVALPR